MKTKYYIIISVFVVISVIIFFYKRCNSYNIVKEKKFDKYLFFNTHEISFNKECYADLIGISFDGSIYDFYKYEINGLIESNIKDTFPQFNEIYSLSQLENINYAYWKKTPYDAKDKIELQYITHASNLNKYDCSMELLELDLLNQEGNYYSYFGAYPIGLHLFIYSPNEKILYIIVKK